VEDVHSLDYSGDVDGNNGMDVRESTSHFGDFFKHDTVRRGEVDLEERREEEKGDEMHGVGAATFFSFLISFLSSFFFFFSRALASSDLFNNVLVKSFSIYRVQ
jgi:hypothetical protein